MDSGSTPVDFFENEDSRRELFDRLRASLCRTVIWEDSVASTNDHAMHVSPRLADTDIPAILLTRQQTRGRGRGQNSWWFGEGAIAFSLLIAPAQLGIPPARWPTLSLAVGGAIATVVDRCFPRLNIRLKWPNDVYFDGRKGCGVLNEAVPGNPERLVIGIGMNVNNSFAEAPSELQQRATSLIDLTGTPIDRGELLLQIVEQLHRDWSDLAVGETTLPDRWRNLCLLTGSRVTIDQSGTCITGTCLGLEDDGALRLQTQSGPQAIYSGSVIEF